MPVIAEEEVAAGRIPAHGDTYFLVDPLDGTKEFVRGGDDYTVNIGLIVGGSPRLGVVYQPATDRLQGGLVGEGAFVEEGGERRPISCRPLRREPRPRSPPNRTSPSRRPIISRRRSARATMSRSAQSLKFCIVAEGRADIYPRLSPTSEWDTAAGHAVLLAAGGRVDGPDGAPLHLWQDGLPQPRLLRHRGLGGAGDRAVSRGVRRRRRSPARPLTIFRSELSWVSGRFLPVGNIGPSGPDDPPLSRPDPVEPLHLIGLGLGAGVPAMQGEAVNGLVGADGLEPPTLSV